MRGFAKAKARESSKVTFKISKSENKETIELMKQKKNGSIFLIDDFIAMLVHYEAISFRDCFVIETDEETSREVQQALESFFIKFEKTMA